MKTKTKTKISFLCLFYYSFIFISFCSFATCQLIVYSWYINNVFEHNIFNIKFTHLFLSPSWIPLCMGSDVCLVRLFFSSFGYTYLCFNSISDSFIFFCRVSFRYSIPWLLFFFGISIDLMINQINFINI